MVQERKMKDWKKIESLEDIIDLIEEINTYSNSAVPNPGVLFYEGVEDKSKIRGDFNYEAIKYNGTETLNYICSLIEDESIDSDAICVSLIRSYPWESDEICFWLGVLPNFTSDQKSKLCRTLGTFWLNIADIEEKYPEAVCSLRKKLERIKL